MCSSKARNAYAKEQLAADFQEGIAEMHAQGQGATSAGGFRWLDTLLSAPVLAKAQTHLR